MGRLRRAVGVAVVWLCASVLGCQSSPTSGTRSAPSPTVARAVPAAVETAASRPTAKTEVWAVEPTDTPAPVRTAVAAPTPASAPNPPALAPVPPPADAGNPGGAVPPPPFAGIPTAQPPPPRPARAFRTPERAGDQVFVAPQGGTAAIESGAETGATGMNTGSNPHATSAVVAFRVSATEAIAGFSVRATYAQSFGHFVPLGGGNGVDCTGAAGAIIFANDTGKGELILNAATAQTLTLPFDVFCRFTVTASERLDASAFQTQIAEVTLASATKGDPAIASVTVSVR